MITELALTYIRIPHENKTKRNRTEPPCEPSRWRVSYRLDGLGLRLPSTDNTRQRLSGEIRQEALSWGNHAGEVGIVGDIMLSRSFPAITATVDSEREHWFLPGSDQNQQIIEGKKIWETQGMLNTHIITLKKKKSNFVLWKVSNNMTNSVMKPTRSSPVSTIIGWQPISFQHFSHLPLSPQSYFQAQLIYHIILPINISVRTSERWLFENNTNIFKSLVSYYNFLKRNVSCEALLYCYLCSPWKHRYMNSNHGYLQEQPLCGSPFPECFPRIIQCYSCINH